ncbi:hypothetical protein C8J56DRAFT_335882 [Mycena floridula]|nr:hypothetical protein C8J56DRAFT_335882 [Mycena floridula]
MEDLPVELWLLVLTFLSKDQIWKLLGISRLFFNMVLNDRYRELRFGCPDKRRPISRYQNPDIAARVQYLHVEPTFLPDEHEMPAQPKSNRRFSRLFQRHPVGERLRSMVERIGKDPVSSAIADGLLVVPHLTNVQCLTLRFYNYTSIQPFSPFLERLWPSISHSLQKLSVTASLSNLSLALQTLRRSSLRLDQIVELRVTLTDSVHQGKHTASTVDLVYFIRDHAQSLRHLSISSGPMNLSALFNQLTELELHLQTIEIDINCQPPRDAAAGALTTFLNSSKNSLQRLVLKPRFHGFDSWYQSWIMGEGLKGIVSFLPSLEMSNAWDITGWALKEQFNNLGSLILLDYISDESALELITHLSQSTSLMKLGISIVRLEENMVQTLVHKLPGLKKLELTFRAVGGNTDYFHQIDSVNANTNSFFTRLEAMRFPDSNLYEVKTSKSCSACQQLQCCPMVSEAMRAAIPSIRVVDTSDECLC